MSNNKQIFKDFCENLPSYINGKETLEVSVYNDDEFNRDFTIQCDQDTNEPIFFERISIPGVENKSHGSVKTIPVDFDDFEQYIQQCIPFSKITFKHQSNRSSTWAPILATRYNTPIITLVGKYYKE